MTRCLVAAALAGWIGATASSAQVRVVRDGDDRLTGIEQVDVLINTTSSTSPACQPTTASLQAAAMEALRAAGVPATVSQKGRSWHYSVVVDVRTAARSATCATSVRTELVAEVAGIPEADSRKRPGEWGSLLKGFMPLVRQTALVIGSPLEHDASVQNTIQAHVAAIATKIAAANP